MARTIENSKNFLIIEMSPKEAKLIGFGLQEGCVCMQCNNIISNPIYYIAVLNDTMCKECFEKWLEYATHYPEDAEIEQRNYDYTSLKLSFLSMSI